MQDVISPVEGETPGLVDGQDLSRKVHADHLRWKEKTSARSCEMDGEASVRRSIGHDFEALTMSIMDYDEELTHRIRELIGKDPDVTEKRMFGGLAFLIGGNMAISASGQGGVLVRADPAQSGRLVASGHAHVAVMQGRELSGWIRVDDEHLRTKRELAKWVTVGTTFARSLPKKR